MLHRGPIQAGLAFLPVGTTIMVTVGVTSRPMAGLGRRIPPAAGVALDGAAVARPMVLTTGTGYTSGPLGPMPASGVGTRMLSMPVTMLGVSDVDPAERGAASGMLCAMRQVGGPLGR
ncbi:hypothetical protein [Streptomyces cellostaticus]|uniref:hypothetical protein n=1 Tax=Streptomyces cellostaticus TaxID=67285 RepID=UPI002025CF2B|nr:hypothetical protein [Streptomyces cellostaticus]